MNNWQRSAPSDVKHNTISNKKIFYLRKRIQNNREINKLGKQQSAPSVGFLSQNSCEDFFLSLLWKAWGKRVSVVLHCVYTLLNHKKDSLRLRQDTFVPVSDDRLFVMFFGLQSRLAEMVCVFAWLLLSAVKSSRWTSFRSLCSDELVSFRNKVLKSDFAT